MGNGPQAVVAFSNRIPLGERDFTGQAIMSVSREFPKEMADGSEPEDAWEREGIRKVGLFGNFINVQPIRAGVKMPPRDGAAESRGRGRMDGHFTRKQLTCPTKI
jgi:hypothetical protein